MLIDDGFLKTSTETIPGYEDYFDHPTTLRFLQEHGDRLVKEIPVDQEGLRKWNQHATAVIALRAEALAVRRPDLEKKLVGYVENQKRETELLAGPIVPAMWLLEKV